MITQGDAAHPVTLSDIIWGLHLIEVHWPPQNPIVIVDMDGAFVNPIVGNVIVTFIDVPIDNDTITINGVEIKFGPSGQVELGTDTETAATNLANYLNQSPHPVDQVTAEASRAHVNLFWDTDHLSLAKSSAVINLIGDQFFADPPLDEGSVITAEMYSGFALYAPYGFSGGFVEPNDLIYLVYTKTISGTYVVHNQYSNRVHRSLLVNMNLSLPIIEIDIFSPGQNNYVYDPLATPPGIYPVRLMQSISNDFVITAYAPGTEFKTEAGGKITTTAAPLWTFSKSIIVEDTRPAPTSIGAVAPYDLVGDNPPSPYGTVKFNKSGEVT